MDSNIFNIDLGFAGTHVLVTGASGAIGSVITKAFLSAGAYVSAWDIVEPKEPFRHEHLHTQLVSITDEAALDRAMEIARSKFGVVSSLIAVAGLDLSYCPINSLADTSLEDWRRVMNVNLDGTFLSCRAWLRGIRSFATAETKNVAAVIFGSEAGIFGIPTCAAYAASKSAIQYGLVKSLARDAVSMHPNARVNAVAPGPVATAQFEKECREDSSALWREAEATVPLRKPVAIETVARVCLVLASDNFAGNITGQVMPIDSGKSGKLFWLENGQAA